MVAHRTNAHIFALYYVLDKKNIQNIHITHPDLIHRMSRVLRLAIGDRCILFDRHAWVEVILTALDKTTLTGKVTAWHDTHIWKPKITFMLPLLKRESLEIAIYNLVQAGVQEIQLVKSAKSRQIFRGEMERLERVIIAAAEQSKNFAFPRIQAPITWEDMLPLLQKSQSYVGDPTGKSIVELACKSHAIPEECFLLVGPEGDFTTQEWEQLAARQVISLQLTPTILKAETAAFYLAALFRSFFSHY